MIASSYKLQVAGFRQYFLLVFYIFFQVAEVPAQDNCKLRKDEDGIKVSTCHVDTSRFKSILTEFDIRCSSEDIKKAAREIINYPKWQFKTLEGKVLRDISNDEKIYRTVIEAPWPVSNRDMVVHLRMIQNQNELVILTNSEVGIFEEVPGLVRVPFSHAQWIVTSKDQNTLHVKYTMLIDPGGSVPAWLVNWTCANAPLQSFQNLKAMLENPEKIKSN